MPPEDSIYFSPFRLDLLNAQLWRGAELLPLRPKPFAVLQYLADNPARVVTRAELSKAVWPRSYVSSGVLRGYIRDLRAVLDDRVAAPKCIETVGRRGYRFIASLTPHPQSVPSSKLQSSRSQSPFVGREAEGEQLQKWLQSAAVGEGQMIFVTGEAGIGKTTLVDAFVAQAEASLHFSNRRSAVWLGRGQCIEHYGIGEAYLPVLEALGRLGQEPGHERLTEVLRRYAPTWLMQLPALLEDPERDRLQREIVGTARERMLRELSDALDALTSGQGGPSPLLILVLEDLQWSDHATLDWLRALARRRASARLVVIGTCRLADAIVSAHPLKGLIQDLQLHGQCVELALGPLSEAAITEYVAARLPGQAQRARSLRQLAGLLYARTDGNPLFMVNVVEDLVAQGLIKERAGHWEFGAAPAEIERRVPESLRQMIEQQVERLSRADQRLLDAGSVAGREFAVAIVAGSLAADVEQIEEQCAGLARQGQLLRASGSREFPDGTVTACYEFVHALHQRVVYDRLTPARCQRLHLQIGEQEERVYGSQVGEIAAELAVHFERARDVPRAVRHHQKAAETAFRRHAYQEAITHLTAGLTLLHTLPDSPARSLQELALLALLGPVLIASKSWGSAVVEATYARARALCEQVGEPPQVFAVLWGAFAVHTGRGELRTAHALAEEILALAQRLQDSGLLMKAHEALGLIAFIRGDLVAARQHYEQALALYDLQQPHALVSLSGPGDCGVSCLSRLAMVLGLMGFAEQGKQRSQEGLTLAQALGNRYSLASAVQQAALTAYVLRDVAATQAYAERDMAISQEWSLSAFMPLGLALRGWALAAQGEAAAGIGQIREGLSHWRAEVAEMVIYGPPLRALLAGAYAQDGRVAEGLQAVTDGLAAVEHSGNRLLEAELWRLKGELVLLKLPVVQSPVKSRRSRVNNRKSPIPNPQSRTEAERCCHRAIAIARRQEAKLFELRATVSLARLWQRQGQKEKARRRLAEIYGWFTEGLETADLQEARVLLERLR